MLTNNNTSVHYGNTWHNHTSDRPNSSTSAPDKAVGLLGKSTRKGANQQFMLAFVCQIKHMSVCSSLSNTVAKENVRVGDGEHGVILAVERKRKCVHACVHTMCVCSVNFFVCMHSL